MVDVLLGVGVRGTSQNLGNVGIPAPVCHQRSRDTFPAVTRPPLPRPELHAWWYKLCTVLGAPLRGSLGAKIQTWLLLLNPALWPRAASARRKKNLLCFLCLKEMRFSHQYKSVRSWQGPGPRFQMLQRELLTLLLPHLPGLRVCGVCLLQRIHPELAPSSTSLWQSSPEGSAVSLNGPW